MYSKSPSSCIKFGKRRGKQKAPVSASCGFPAPPLCRHTIETNHPELLTNINTDTNTKKDSTAFEKYKNLLSLTVVDFHPRTKQFIQM